MAAAELAVTAQTLLVISVDEPLTGRRRNSHSARTHWTKVQVGLGNTTPDAHETLVTLGDLRGAARYGEGNLPAPERVGALLAAVSKLLENAAPPIGAALANALLIVSRGDWHGIVGEVRERNLGMYAKFD